MEQVKLHVMYVCVCAQKKKAEKSGRKVNAIRSYMCVHAFGYIKVI